MTTDHTKTARMLHSSSPRHQRGAFTIITALLLFALLACLLLITDSGRLYLEKRSLQRAADTAALEAIARGGCYVGDDLTDAEERHQAEAVALALAQQYASENIHERSGFTPADEVDITIHCVSVATDSEAGFPLRKIAGDGHVGSSVHVTLNKETRGSLLCAFIGNSCTFSLQASAVAGRSDAAKLAVFTAGSKLADLGTSSSALGPLLRGIGLNLDNTSLVGYNGLADVTITPSGLLEALELELPADLTVGSINALIEGEGIRLGQLLDAALTAANRNELLGLNAQLLQTIKAKLRVDKLEAHIPLFRDEAAGKAGIFALTSTGATTIDSALGVDVSVLDIMTSAIGIATQNHAVETRTGLNLLGLKADIQLGLVEPPSIGIGSIGAKAYTAQLRTFIHISSENFLGGLLNLLNIKINLPIILELVTGTAEITDLCDANAGLQDRAEFNISGKVAKICLGELNNPNDLFSKTNACDAPNLYKSNTSFINVLNLLSLRGQLIELDVLDFSAHQTLAETETGSTHNSLNLGATISGLATKLAELLFNQNSDSGAQTARALAEKLWESSASECAPHTVTASCHRARMDAIDETLRDESSGLPPGLITGLLGGVLGLVGDLLSGLIGVVAGNGCTFSGLLGSVSEAGCINQLQGELAKSSPGLSGITSNALAAILSIVTSLLEPILNLVGNTLASLLSNLLGLDLGVVDVYLQDLSCNAEGQPQLLH